MGAAAFGAFGPFRQQFFRRMVPPGIAAFLVEDGGNLFHGFFVDQGFPTVFAVEDRMGTPQTLCREMHQSWRSATMLWIRDSPQLGIHWTSSAMAFRASSRNPVHRSEPLLGSPEDDGVLAAPAVGVLVMDGLFAQDGILFRQVLDHQPLLSKTNLPWNSSPASSVKQPFWSTGHRMGRLYFRPVR